MKTNRIWKRLAQTASWGFCAAALLATAGCFKDDLSTDCPIAGADMVQGDGGAYVQLDLTARILPMSKAGEPDLPEGGENGDGSELGQDYENELANITAFFYQGYPIGDANAADGTLVTAITFDRVVKQSDNTTYKTDPVQVDLDNGRYQVLVVANADVAEFEGKTLTLGDLKRYIRKTAWTYDEAAGGTYSRFTMASAQDAALLLDSNPIGNPATTRIPIERLAARVDYQAKASYTCTDSKYPDATVEIVGATLVNNLTAGSYLLKRVADDIDGQKNFAYLGDETDADGVSTNYVLDPWSALKTAANLTGAPFTVDGQMTDYAGLYGVSYANFPKDPNQWAALTQPGTELSTGGEQWMRAGYTLENTFANAEASKYYNTGIVFRAQFHPKGISGYTDGTTFFEWKSVLFPTAEAMMEKAFGTDAFASLDTGVDVCATWADASAMANALPGGDPTGYRQFLGQRIAAHVQTDNISEADKEALKWKNYMLAECGYSLDGSGKVVLDQSGKVTQQALQPFGVRTYEDAMCYYTWWLRHSKDATDGQLATMRYGVVRNNVYKLMVTSVYSLGDDVPDNENIILDVYVRNWQMLPEETMEM